MSICGIACKRCDYLWYHAILLRYHTTSINSKIRESWFQTSRDACTVRGHMDSISKVVGRWYHTIPDIHKK